VEFGVFDFSMMGIPQGRPAKRGHFTVSDGQILIMPEGVAQVKITVLCLNVPAFLKGTFSIRRTVEGTVLHRYIFAAVQGTFLVKSLILDEFHLKAS